MTIVQKGLQLYSQFLCSASLQLGVWVDCDHSHLYRISLLAAPQWDGVKGIVLHVSNSCPIIPAQLYYSYMHVAISSFLFNIIYHYSLNYAGQGAYSIAWPQSYKTNTSLWHNYSSLGLASSLAQTRSFPNIRQPPEEKNRSSYARISEISRYNCKAWDIKSYSWSDNILPFAQQF